MKKNFIDPEMNISLFNQEVMTDGTVPAASSVQTTANIEEAQNWVTQKASSISGQQQTTKIILFD